MALIMYSLLGRFQNGLSLPGSENMLPNLGFQRLKTKSSVTNAETLEDPSIRAWKIPVE
jgi:hypothetical protein